MRRIRVIRTRMKSRTLSGVVPWLIAFGGAAAVTAIGRGMNLNANTTGFAFLIVVLLSSLRGGLLIGTVASIVATLCYNFFFFPPLYTFTIHETANWVALAVFLVTSVVVSRLVIAARIQAERAEQRRNELETLVRAQHRSLHGDESRRRARRGGRTRADASRRPRRWTRALRWESVSAERDLVERRQAGRDRRPHRRRGPSQRTAGVPLPARSRRLPAAARRRQDDRRARRARNGSVAAGARLRVAARRSRGRARAVHRGERARAGACARARR